MCWVVTVWCLSSIVAHRCDKETHCGGCCRGCGDGSGGHRRCCGCGDRK